MQPFASALAHGRALVELTRLMVARLAMLRGADETGARRPAAPVSAREVAARIAGPVSPAELRARAEALDAPIDQADQLIRARAEAAARAGLGLPFARFERELGLAAVEARLVAALFAIELDPDLARALVALGDDPTRRRPEVALLAALIGGIDEDRLDAAHRALAPDGTLRRRRLIVVSSGDHAYGLRTVRLADRIVDHLRGHLRFDEVLTGYAQLVEPAPPAAVVLPAALRAQLERAVAEPRARLLVTGPDGVGKTWATVALLGATRRAVIRADLAALVADVDLHGERLSALFRELALRDGSALVLAGGADLRDTLDPAVAARLAEALDQAPAPVVFTAPTMPKWLPPLLPEIVELAMPLPGFRDRIELWSRALAAGGVPATPEDIEQVAGRYTLGAGSIGAAARRAAATAVLRAPVAPTVDLEELSNAARQMFSSRLGTMAQRIPTSFTWDDLVLPEEPLEQLREVARFARMRPHLLETWGFARKLPYGRGLSVILAGPPGTGKTMVAQILAHELGYDLYRIDLSQVVNKYIGETEKNLARIFDEAETSHAVLFFDEADSLFAKRTDVKSSNDRYANLEVNYLLQRMETYDGVTLLATNLEQGLDPAFKRRVRFTVQFDLPEADERERLWRSMFPSEVPLAADINWQSLAAGFEMTGGYIKRAALRAALAAASASSRPISHADLVAAARQEYRDMGRIVGG